jgi:hypothetical protein
MYDYNPSFFQGVWLGVSDDITCVEQSVSMDESGHEKIPEGTLAKFMQYHDCLMYT